MATVEFTILDEGSASVAPAIIQDDRIIVDSQNIKRALSWELKPEGFCQGTTCISIPGDSSVVGPAGIDLVQFASLVDRPLALDLEERAAYLGVSAGARAESLAGLQAPNFTLPDLDGKTHSLSDYRGRKVLLVAYASW